MNQRIPTPKAVAWFGTALCIITMLISLISSDFRNAFAPLVPFFAFLPAVLFFNSSQQNVAATHIRKLEQRIAELERITRH
jgi:hypothetical protein